MDREEGSMKKAYAMSSQEVAQKLTTDLALGLTHEEARARLNRQGRNELVVENDPVYKKYLDQFKDPLVLMLLASAAVSLLMHQYDDAISIALAIVIVSTVAFIQEYRSEQALQALKKLVPNRARCMRSGKVDELDAEDLVEGDIVFLSLGDKVPADIRLFEATSLQVDESSLTGEGVVVTKNADVCPSHTQLDISERFNMVFMGTLVRGGKGKGIVIGVSKNTEFGAVFELMADSDEKKTPLQENMSQLGKQLSIGSMAVIVGIVLIGWIQRKSFMSMVTIGVSLAVAAIPEGLPIVVTVTLALGVRRMAARDAIVKKLPAVESLGCASVVCVDKTGTLTTNEMTLTSIYVFERRTQEVTVDCNGYKPVGGIFVDGVRLEPRLQQDIVQVLEVGNLCNDAQLNTAEHGINGTPTEGALLVGAYKLGCGDLRDRFYRVDEVPFDSKNKFMAVNCVPYHKTATEKANGTGPPYANERRNSEIPGLYYVKGAVEVLLPMCTTYMRSGSQTSLVAGLTKESRWRIRQDADAMANKGLRVICLCTGETLDNLNFVGLAGICDPARKEAESTIQLMREAGIRTVMITGDNRNTACHIASELGFYDEKRNVAMSGKDLDEKPEAEIRDLLPVVSVFYRTSPKHKMRIVSMFRQGGDVVAMTGDGVNDAPALRAADIGIAMGNGTDVSKEAADMILVNNDLWTIYSAVREGKTIFHNIRNFVRFQLSTSAAALLLIATSTMVGLDSPLNAMQILWINIIMDGPPAQSLGMEPVDEDLMKHPPRSKSEPIITRELLKRVAISAVIMFVVTLLIHTEFSESDAAYARTATFMAFVSLDMFNALSCRSASKPLARIGFFSNKVFLQAVGGSLIGQLLVVYSPWGQHIFQTLPLAPHDMFIIVCASSSVFIVHEGLKYKYEKSGKSF